MWFWSGTEIIVIAPISCARLVGIRKARCYLAHPNRGESLALENRLYFCNKLLFGFGSWHVYSATEWRRPRGGCCLMLLMGTYDDEWLGGGGGDGEDVREGIFLRIGPIFDFACLVQRWPTDDRWRRRWTLTNCFRTALGRKYAKQRLFLGKCFRCRFVCSCCCPCGEDGLIGYEGNRIIVIIIETIRASDVQSEGFEG